MITPDEALERLMRGNARFASGITVNPNRTVERRAEVAGGQMPFAIMLGCSDSRVPLEIIFDQGLGDLFIVRVAGNIFDRVVLGSIEFAAQAFHSPLLMVLGHDKCGAVDATLKAVETNADVPGRIAEIVDAIRPVVVQVQAEPGDMLSNVTRANVLHVVHQLNHADSFISQLQADGALKIVGAIYHLETGKVELLT